MKYSLIICSLFCLWLWGSTSFCATPKKQSPSSLKAAVKNALPAQHRASKNNKPPAVFKFDYTDAPIIDVINELAAASNVNIVLPQGASTITTKLTFHTKDRLTLEQAWDKLQNILSLAGYTIAPKENMLAVLKVDNNIKRDTLPIYYNESLLDIPSTDQVIRAVFFLSNIDLSITGDKIREILIALLTKDSADVQLEKKTNAVILTDKAANIKAVMKIIFELDQSGTRDAIEVIPLLYTSATLIEDLFTKLIPAGQPTAIPFGPQSPAQKQATYFPKNTRVVALERLNALIIMGTMTAINTVKNFVIKYLDHPLESGESILHIYDLQYLNAEKFESILQNIIKPDKVSEQAKGKPEVGAKQFYKDVIIKAEKTRKAEEVKTTELGGETAKEGKITPQPIDEGEQQGGNRLIIAARQKDWLRLRNLIATLDKPQPQIAIEVLVFDINLESTKILASQTRNKEGFNQSLLDSINFQVANIGSPVLKPQQIIDGSLQYPADALMANLLQVMVQQQNESEIRNNLAITASTGDNLGSTIVSFQDGSSGIWNLWQILNRFTTTNLIAQPYVVVANNQSARTVIRDERFLTGGASDAQGGAINVPNEYVEATIAIDIRPRISQQTGTINLNVVVQISEFLSNLNNRISRIVQTNANMGNGEVLALGGLNRIRESLTQSETPFLGKVPLVGWFFKRKSKSRAKNMLAIFLSATIISPLVGGGADTFTKRKLDYSVDGLNESLLFANLRDPITRWFFKPSTDIRKNVINRYIRQSTENYFVWSKEKLKEQEEMEEFKKSIASADNPLEHCNHIC